jgi:hypothetical protein
VNGPEAGLTPVQDVGQDKGLQSRPFKCETVFDCVLVELTSTNITKSNTFFAVTDRPGDPPYAVLMQL